jgi:2-methylisocitrate lyase-like PEP mutase family enzyme
LIFVEAPQSEDEIARIPREVDAPVMYNWVRGGHSPDVRLEQLQEWGYAMTILPGLLVGTVVRAMMRALAKAGAPTPMSPDIISPADLFNTVGLDDWLAAGERYTAG